jgi:hypothetical protein
VTKFCPQKNERNKGGSVVLKMEKEYENKCPLALLFSRYSISPDTLARRTPGSVNPALKRSGLQQISVKPVLSHGISLYLSGNSRPSNARVSKPRAQRSSLRSNTARPELEGDGGCRTRATRRVASLSLSLPWPWIDDMDWSSTVFSFGSFLSEVH